MILGGKLVKMKRNLIYKHFCFLLCGSLFAACISGCGLKNDPVPVGEENAGQTVSAENAFVPADTIEIAKSSEYEFNPEEIMYLSGVKVSAYTPGVSYTLSDRSGDGIPELFVSDGISVFAYEYDEETGFAKKSTAFESDAAEIKDSPDVIWVDDSQWVDGSIYGVASQIEDPGLKNDYYTSSNYEWLSKTNVRFTGDMVSPTDEVNDISEKKREMFEDREKYDGEDIRRVRRYYDIATDWEKRNEEGVAPVKKYLDAIENIGSIDEMSDYLSDPAIDPFCMFFTFRTTLDSKDTSHWIATIQGDEFSVLPRIFNNSEKDEIPELRAEYDITVRYILERSGYSSDDTDRILDEFHEVEDILLEKDWISDDEDENDALLTPMPLDDLSLECTNFPVVRILKARGMECGCVNADYPAYLRALDELYTKENLSNLKSYCLAHTAYEASKYLDLDSLNAYYAHEGADLYDEETLNERYLYEFLEVRSIVGVASENAYMTYFVDDEEREDITALAGQIKDAFRQIIEDEEWMSDEGKKAAIEKLDNMKFNILRPDTLIDTSYLEVDEGMGYLDAYALLKNNTRKHMAGFVGKERISGDWRYDIQTECTTTVNNCFYYGAFNQFFILDGFITDGTYRKDMTTEEKLGTLGEVIGHELTHGFDPMGIQYDKNGNMVVDEDNPGGWMPEEDYKTYNERAERLADYFSTFVPYPYNKCDGHIYRGEAAADITGMQIILRIASDIDGFDYDKLFRSHSRLWVKQSTLIVEQGDIFNEHPLYYLRINAVNQQFEEFYDTYDIHEGDAMYLAPEDRICIW